MALQAQKLSGAFEKWAPALNGIFETQNFLTCGNHALRVPFYKEQIKVKQQVTTQAGKGEGGGGRGSTPRKIVWECAPTSKNPN